MVKFGKLLVMGAQDFGKELDKDYMKDVLATGYDDLTGSWSLDIMEKRTCLKFSAHVFMSLNLKVYCKSLGPDA